MPKSINITEKFLLEEYVNKNKTLSQIAKELGCCREAVAKHCRKHNITIRDKGIYLTKNLLGQKFGKLKVIEKTDRRTNNNGGVIWKCECECGNYHYISGNSLSKGEVTRCQTCRQGQELPIFIWGKWIAGAKTRGIPFQITREEGLNIFLAQNKLCAISGLPIKFATSQSGLIAGENTASLDRIDSCGIYEISNVQWVHKDIQRMKWEFPQDKFIGLCKVICQNNTSTGEQNESH